MEMIIGSWNYLCNQYLFTTNVVSSNPVQAIQHYVIKFVSDLQQVGGFLRFLPPIKLTTTI